MRNKIFLFVLIGLLIINTISAEGFGYNLLEAGKNLNPIKASVNASEFWITNVGALDDVNTTQFSNTASGTLNIIESYIQRLITGGTGERDTWRRNYTFYWNASMINNVVQGNLTSGDTWQPNKTLYYNKSQVDNNFSLYYTKPLVNSMISGNASSGTNYYPSTINLTTSTYTGRLWNGTTLGYFGANAICNAEFIDSHMCNEFEILLWYANGGRGFNNNNTWVITGGGKFIPADVPVNDCNGFTYNGTVTYLGSYYHFNDSTGGDIRNLNCGTEFFLPCCTY